MISRRGILALVILAGLAGLVFYDFRSGRARQEREAEEKKVFHLEPDQVDTVVLDRDDGRIVLHRTDDGWGLEEPVTTPADATAADGLVDSLVHATIEKRLGTEGDLSGYGLAEGATGVEISGGEGEDAVRERLQVGGKHPFGGDYYARIGDDPDVVLVSSGVARARDAKLFDLRDRKLIELQNWKMKSLEIQGSDRTFGLVRDRGHWNLETPVRTPAEDGTVADLVSQLGRMEAKAFAADDPADLGAYGLDNPRVRVTLMQDGWTEPHRIDFGSESPDGNLYARRWDRAAVVEVEKSIWPKLNPTLETLRSPEILQVSRWDVSGIEVEDSGGTLRLAKDDSDAWRDETADRPVDRTRVEELLDAVEGLKAERYLDDPGDDLSAYGLDAPRIRLALRTSGGGEGENPGEAGPAAYEILVGAEKDGYDSLRAGDWPSVFQVPAAEIGKIEAGLAALRAAGREPLESEDVGDGKTAAPEPGE